MCTIQLDSTLLHLQAENEAAPAQQTIEGPPERLMIENGHATVNPRFAAEEKALEEQLLREEEEEIAKERYGLDSVSVVQRAVAHSPQRLAL